MDAELTCPPRVARVAVTTYGVPRTVPVGGWLRYVRKVALRRELPHRRKASDDPKAPPAPPQVNPEWREQVRVAILAMRAIGWSAQKPLGCGEYGCAYTLEDRPDRILKITGDPTDAAAWALLRDLSPRPPGLPVADCVFAFRAAYPRVYGIVLPRLYPTAWTPAEEKLLEKEVFPLVWTADDPRAAAIIAKSQSPRFSPAFPQHVARMVNMFTSIAAAGVTPLDLHLGNVLWDAHGNTLISDLGGSWTGPVKIPLLDAQPPRGSRTVREALPSGIDVPRTPADAVRSVDALPPQVQWRFTPPDALSVPVPVDPVRLDSAWRRGNYIEADSIPERAVRFRKALEDNRSIKLPQLTLGGSPWHTPSFLDGRHEYAILRDLGVRPIWVTVARDQATNVLEQYGAEGMVRPSTIPCLNAPRGAITERAWTVEQGLGPSSPNWKAEESRAREALHAAGIVLGAQLGVGAWGTAYVDARDPMRVIKITGDPTEAAAAETLVRADTWDALPAIGRIFCVYRFANTPVFAIFQERLWPLTPADFAWIRRANLWEGLIAHDEPAHAEIHRRAGIAGFTEKIHALETTLMGLEALGVNYYDLHAGNLLRDVGGAWKIVDLGNSSVDVAPDVGIIPVAASIRDDVVWGGVREPVQGVVREGLPSGAATTNQRVSAKIRALMHEGVPQKQAVATALNMEETGRLTDDGLYVPASAPIFTVRVERDAGDAVFVVRAYKEGRRGGGSIGEVYVGAPTYALTPACVRDVQILRAKHPDARTMFTIWSAKIDKPYRGKGIGALLYVAAVKHAAQAHGAFLLAGDCQIASATTTESAKRVWSSTAFRTQVDVKGHVAASTGAYLRRT